MTGSLGEAVLDLVGDTTGLARDLEEAGRMAESRLMRIGDKMQRAGATLTRSLTLPILGVGVAAGKMSMDFETSMQHIVGLVGISQKQVDVWAKDLMRLGPELGKSPKELAEALYFVASSGIDTSKAIDVVVASAKAASAGLGDTQVVADAVSSALNAYAGSNLTAAQATAILVSTVREGKGEASEIAPALGRVIPIAAQMGISFDQVGAAMAGMTLVGFDAAESATNLSGIMSAFLKPSKQAKDALAAYGLSAEGVRDSIQKKGLLSALDMLRVKIGDDDEALAAIFPNIRGFRGLLSLTGENAEQTAQIFAALAGTTEADLNSAFEAVTTTGAFQFQQAMAQMQDLLIVLGNAVIPAVLPVLRDLSGTVKTIADWFTALPAPVQNSIVVVAALVAALGPLLTVGGNVLTLIGGIAGIMTGPFALAIAAVMAGIALLAANWDTIWPQIQGTVQNVIAVIQGVLQGFVQGAQDLWNRFGAQIMAQASLVWNSIQTIINTVLAAVAEFIALHGEEIRAFFQSAWERIQGIIQTVLNIINATIVPALSAIATFIAQHKTTIVTILDTAWNTIRTIIDTVINVISGILNTVMAIIKGDWEGAWNSIRTTVENIWNSIKTLWDTFWRNIETILKSLGLDVQKAWDNFWRGLRNALEGIWNDLKRGWEAFWGALVGAIGRLKAAVETAWNNFWGGIRDAALSIINPIKDAIESIKRAWDNFWGSFQGQSAQVVAATGNGTNGTSAGPGRAIGGRVWPGLSYIVGERRPELFEPDVPGRIVPNVRNATSAVTNQYYLTANYAVQEERSLRDDVRMMQMLSG